jgi:hypothetical protein
MDEAESIKLQIAALPAPTDINGIDVDFGLDSTDDPAVWIYLHVPDENPTRDVAAKLAEYASAVTSVILEANDGRRWPYVHFRSP